MRNARIRTTVVPETRHNFGWAAMSLFGELSRRNVFRVGLAYLAASWVFIQIIDVVQPILGLPDWTAKFVLVILTVGLVVVLVFAWAFELTPEGIKREKDVDRSKSVTHETGKKLNYVTLAAVAVAIVLTFVQRTPDPSAVAAPDSESVVADTAPLSIAVLPFVNMSSDIEQEHFSDGITEEILNALASVQDLKVAGRTSSFAFKGQNDDLRRIGDSLDVAHILEGSVRKSGDTVRITAQLIKVDDGYHMWSETYDRQLDNVFAIQDDIANSILRELKVHLLDERAEVVEAARTSPEVLELYFRARQRIYTRERAEIELAIEELDRAIDLDTEYAPVYAQRGIATMLLSESQYGDLPIDESNRRGKRFVDQALELDPDLAEAWAALGLYEGREGVGNPDAAIDALAKALEMNPNNIDASNWLYVALLNVGDPAGARDIIEELVERDPLYRPAFSNAISSFAAFNQIDKAERLIERIAAFDPENPDVLHARSVLLVTTGQAGTAANLMAKRAEMGNMSGPAYFIWSIALGNLGAPELAVENLPLFMHEWALYELGRVDEALQSSRSSADMGFPQTYFYILLREGREQDLVNFVEERWPNVRAFAAEHAPGTYDWDPMTHLGTAYKRLGNAEVVDEVTVILQKWQDDMSSLGVDNAAFSVSRAAMYSLMGDDEQAIDTLEQAIDGGIFMPAPSAIAFPALEFIDDPALTELDQRMLVMLNEQRQIAGLLPFDENYQPMPAE